MSTATETQTQTLSRDVVRLLADYDLHHTGSESGISSGVTQNSEVQSSQSTNVNNPYGWPDDYRGVPNYRPARTRDLAEYPAGANPVEGAIVLVVMNGAGLIGAASMLWRSTVGRFNDQIFRYAVGGEK